MSLFPVLFSMQCLPFLYCFLLGIQCDVSLSRTVYIGKTMQCLVSCTFFYSAFDKKRILFGFFFRFDHTFGASMSISKTANHVEIGTLINVS